MQDIVFYAAANETLGMIRDYANERNSSAPVLTLGVSVCLRMRLFASVEGAAPYPITVLNDIAEWQWSMDSDFDRGTACKLVADANSISVHTETDTVNGETMNFTEFVIPITNMNTEELAAWLGNEKMKTGLTGELVGYDSGGNAAFVLQIENFSVRNRVAGLGDPTVLDQEIVTRTQAEHMIQTAVSTLAAAKQDKLTSSNAGSGISITSAGIISTADIPQSAVTGLVAGLNSKQNVMSAGYRMELVSGSTVDQSRYFAIEPVITAPSNSTATVVLSAGKAYEIHAVANNAKVLLNRENPVGGNRTFGLEGHAEIFVANTGYIQTGANVVLVDALEPDAVNNCTVRFHDGLAVISVEDHVAGYIVNSISGSAEGTLPYGIESATSNYIAFDATANGAVIDLSDATANSEKHIVGNGYADTALTGAVNCGTGKFTVANLSMLNVAVNGGTMTLGDVYIPSGSTVSVSGGRLAVENVSADGGVIALGGTNIIVPQGGRAVVSGAVVSGGVGTGGGAFYNFGNLVLQGCELTGNSATTIGGGAVATDYDGVTSMVDCHIHDNNTFGGTLLLARSASVFLTGCTIGTSQTIRLFAPTTNMTFYGSNKLAGYVESRTNGGSIVISSGAVVDLTGNANATPLNPGGTITLYGGSYMKDTNIYGSAGSATQSRGFSAECTVTGSSVTNTGAIAGATVTLPSSSCEISFIKSGEATVSSVYIQADQTPYVLETQQGAGTVLVRVVED